MACYRRGFRLIVSGSPTPPISLPPPTTHHSSTTESYGAMSQVALFFSSYSNFTLDEDAAVTKEFLRLKKVKRWKDGDDEYTDAREMFADALAEDFNATYGTDIDNIEHWRVLCHVLKIDPVPEDIKACRKVREHLPNESVSDPSSHLLYFAGRQVKARQSR
jgi:hypothetical protein